MSSDAGTLELLAHFIGDSLSPLKDRLQAGEAAHLFEELGLRPPAGFMAAGGIGGELANSASIALQLSQTLPPLATAIDNVSGDDLGSIATLVQRGVDSTQKIVALLAAIKDLATAIDTGAASLGAAQKATVQAFAAELPPRLLEYLLLANLERNAPRVVSLLAVAGLAEDCADSWRRERSARAFRIERDACASTRSAGWPRIRPVSIRIFMTGASRASMVKELFGPRRQRDHRAGLPATILRPPGQPAVLEALLVRATYRAGSRRSGRSAGCAGACA